MRPSRSRAGSGRRRRRARRSEARTAVPLSAAPRPGPGRAGPGRCRVPATAARRAPPPPRRRAVEHRRLSVAVGGALRRKLQLDPERDEPLLCPVVQVGLDPTALFVGGRLDPGARLSDLAQQRGGLDREPIVVQRHHRIGGRALDERVIGLERRVVHDGRHGSGPVGHLGHAALRFESVPVHVPAVAVRPAAVAPLADAVQDLQRRVVERVGECPAQLRGTRVRP